MITQQIKLNLIPGQVFPRVNASQYDSGTRTLQMALYNGDQVFNIASGMTAVVQGTKPDKTGFQYAATITEGSNIATLDITQQMTAVKGDVICELVISNGNNRIATVNFILYVEAAALAGGTVISETDLPLIEEAAELAQTIGPIAQQVNEDAQTASNAATRAEDAAEAAETWSSNAPYIGANDHWYVYDSATEQFVDTGVSAEGQTGPQGPQGPTGETGATGPQGPTGATGNGITSITKTSTVGLVDTYTILFTDGTSTTFTVTNGQDGQGSGDMTKAVYDASDAVADAGGIVAYVQTHSGSDTLAGLTDVALSSLATGQSLVYNATTQKWVNAQISYANISGKPTLGTAAAKDSTNTLSSGSTDLIESGAVHSAIQTLTDDLSDLSDEVDKTYKSDDATETSMADDDYIPFYDSSAQTTKKISKANANFGGGGAGSLFVIRTDETELYGQTVNITDGVLVWQGQFNNSGVAEVLGVTAIGALTITATDGTETAETIYTVKNYSRYEIKLNFYTVYGFRIDSTKSTGNVSYKVQYNGDNVENYDFTPGYMNFTTDTWIWGSWTGEEFFMPRPVLIKQDYSEKIYLNPDNLSLDEDGNDVSSELTGATDGYNAMMEWGRNGKKIWYKLVPETDDATYTCYIADKQLDSDFHAWSFYDANNVLGDHFYTSIYNGSTVSNVLRSLSGKTPNNTTAGATQITQAKANNQNSESYAWYIDVFADRILINLLMILVIQSTNSDVIGYGNYTGGSSASNLLTTGQGNTKGMFYGKQSNSVCKVFGMENWFANCWRRMAGLILNGGAQLYKLTYGTADGSSAAGYIENDNAPSNYLNAGKSIATNLSSSYIVKESALSNGALVASAFDGSNGTYYSDACWSSTGVKYALVGGACSYGSPCGTFALNLGNALSYSGWSGGCALSLKPLAQ